MHTSYRACVLVTDGRKIIFLRDEGEPDYPDLQTLWKTEEFNSGSRDQPSTGA